MNKVEARHYLPHATGAVKCLLCPRACLIEPGQKGQCLQRLNVAGNLQAVGYGQCAALAVDPIEKKPLYHFYPGSKVVSVGGFGCNLTCLHCQNWQLSQRKTPTRHITPQQLVESCLELKAEDDQVNGIAFTYSEPGVWFEFVQDTAKLARASKLHTVMVTNGYLSPKPFAQLAEHIEAFNVDVKAFTQNFYQDITGGRLEVVKHNISFAVRQSSQVELTYLVIPTLNDSVSEVTDLVKWIASVDKEMPLHLSRYFPNYKLDLPPTPIETMQELYELAKKHLPYVYMGNVRWPEGTATYCPSCNKLLVTRLIGGAELIGITESGICKGCGQAIPIKFH